ncbi:MAG: M67 family metallopeptidase [Nitrospirota bacterium]
MIISRGQLNEMIEHAKAEYPKEACGILGGKDGRVERVYRMRNVDASTVTYLMDSKEWIMVDKKLRESGESLIGIYHSHTSSESYPSLRDIELAPLTFYPEAEYVIISLSNMGSPEIKSYNIIDGSVLEKEIVIV